MTKIALIIPTYNRPHLLKKLLSDIDHPDIKVFIFNDCSNRRYIIKPQEYPIRYYRMTEHHGKRKYWRLVNYMFGCLKSEEFDYFFMLPDDCRLTEGFFDRSIELYNSIRDGKKICLSLCTHFGRIDKKHWVNFKPKKYNSELMLTNWNDLCFMATRKFLQALNYEISKPSPHRWKFNRRSSSGVGRNITRRLFRKYTMYHSLEDLVIEGTGRSVMNPPTRTLRKKRSV